MSPERQEIKTGSPIVETDIHTAPRCVDGREDPHSLLGPQMLGGSIHPILLAAMYSETEFDASFITQQAGKLKESGFALGAHRGAHMKLGDNVSDCGAADRTADIIATAVSPDGRKTITERLTEIYEANKDSIQLNKPFEELLQNSFDKIIVFGLSRVKIRGDNTISAIERQGGVIETVKKDHDESRAYLNLIENTTLDTKVLNAQGKQAFNLDLWAAVGQASALGVDEEFAIGASLILYVATEMVLVEQKGKQALSVALL